MTRTIRFRLPVNPERTVTRDQRAIEAASWKFISKILSIDDQVQSASPEELAVLKTFGLASNSLLTVEKPSKIPDPFKFFTTHNSQHDYVTEPRLAVTKLLTGRWCELREYYDIYRGLETTRNTRRIKSGVDYHEKLETSTYPTVDETQIQQHSDSAMALLSDSEQNAVLSTPEAYELAKTWLEKIIVRLLHVIDSGGQIREMAVHGFLDLDSGALVTEVADLDRAILVNGVIDVVQIHPKESEFGYGELGFFDGFQSFSLTLEDSSVTLVDSSVTLTGPLLTLTGPLLTLMDPLLTPFQIVKFQPKISKLKQKMDNLAKKNNLNIHDVKTRASNSIPRQKLVIEAARDQCMYYGAFLENLARNKTFAFESFMENARRRQIDPKTPISPAFATHLLAKYFQILAVDCVKLAKGIPIGINLFDDNPPPEQPFSLLEFMLHDQFKQLLHDHYGESEELNSIDVSALFQQWKVPITLQYFAARCSESFHLFNSFRVDSVCVEYHHVRECRVIAAKHFLYLSQLVKETIRRACGFWNGTRAPVPTLDVSRCGNCVYSRRCPANESGI